MGNILYQWLDLIWLPVAWFVVHKKHRGMALAFVAACILTLRTQVEMMRMSGLETGILPLLDGPLLSRGYIVYGIVICLFLILAYFSQTTEKMIFFTAVLSIYIFAVCISMVIMVL